MLFRSQYRGPEMRLLEPGEPLPRVDALGPDLLGQDDPAAIGRRLLAIEPTRQVGEAVMDQRVMSGIGNVYRCEVLWSCGIHPWATVGSIPESTCLDLVLTAAGQLRANLTSPVRITAPDVPGGLAVYGRNGQCCSRCGDVIRLTKHGEMARLLYWCPGCQTGCEPYPVVDNSDPVARATDPHPAGSLFVGDVLRHRDAS